MTTISTSTSAFFERAKANISTLRAHADGLQEQLSRGDRLTRSSDDPVAASRLRTLLRADRLSTVDTANMDSANTSLSLADTTLASLAASVGRAKQLAAWAASDTLTSAQRASIGDELTAIRGNVLALANTRDANGFALFGGESTGAAYTLDSNGDAAYAGTASSGVIAIGDGQTIPRGITGPEFLNFTAGGTATDLLAVLKTLGDGLEGGAPATTARASLDALDTGLDAITRQQTIVGTRMNWLDLVNERATTLTEQRASAESDVGGIDIATSVVDLQRAMLVLEASQTSFSRLASLNLFNQLN